MTHVKRPWERKQKSQGHVTPAPTSAVYLSSSPQRLGFMASSPPDNNIFTWKKLREGFNFRGAFIKIIWCKPPASYSSRSAYFQTCPPGAMGVFLCGPVPVLWMVPVLCDPWNTSVTKITMCWVLSGWQDCFPFSLSWAVFVYIGNVLFLNIQPVSTST